MAKNNFDEIFFATLDAEDPIVVRVTKEPINGLKRVSLRDLIMATCAKKDPNQACEVWRRLPKEFQDELKPHMEEFKFSGRGQQFQPVLSLQGCFKLLMVLNNNHARRFRSASAHVLLGFFSGDAQIAGIRGNADYSGLINELAREEFNGEGSQALAIPNDEFKKRQQALELGKQELALKRALLRVQIDERRKLYELELEQQCKTAKAARAIKEKDIAAEIEQQNKIADAARATREKDMAAEIQSQAKMAAALRDKDDRDTAAKRRRMEEDELAKRRNMDAEIALERAKGDALLDTRRKDVTGAVTGLVEVLRATGQSADVIAAATRALLTQLHAVPASGGAPPGHNDNNAVHAPGDGEANYMENSIVERPQGYFTVREFMNEQQTQLFLEVRPTKREQFLKNLGARLTAECKSQIIDFKRNIKVAGEVFHVNVYAPAAAHRARLIAESIVRNMQAAPNGGTQPDVRFAWTNN